MKKLLFLIILSTSTTIAKAKCAMDDVSCWPTKTTINRNSLIIVELYGFSQTYLPEIIKLNHILLQSNIDTVHLKIVKVNKGQFGITQIILQPVKVLKSGYVYEIILCGLSKKGTISRWNRDAKKMENVKWLVNDKIDNQSPKWVLFPKFHSKTLVEYGCGPAKWVYFNCKSNDSSEVLIKATVKSKKTNIETVYFLITENNQIRIGHGMCSGAFLFDKGDDYEVTFLLMDESGNISKQKSKPYIFSKPTENTQSE